MANLVGNNAHSKHNTSGLVSKATSALVDASINALSSQNEKESV